MSNPHQGISKDIADRIVRLTKNGKSIMEIKEILGVGESTVNRYRAKMKKHPETFNEVFERPILPSDEKPIEEILHHAVSTYQRKRAAYDARKLIDVKIKMDGPIGLHLFGDPHLDDNGCNYPLLME